MRVSACVLFSDMPSAATFGGARGCGLGRYTMFWDHVAGSFRDHPDSIEEKTATLKSE